jgi:hypothetical protein
MKTTEQLVREIADRQEIYDLAHRYCDCLWRKDLDGLVKLFTDEGVFKAEGVETEAVVQGHKQLKKMYQKSIEEMNPRVFIQSRIVDLIDDRQATGRCYVAVYNASVGMELLGFAYYEDEYAKVKDSWKFATRRYFIDVVESGISLRTFMV